MNKYPVVYRGTKAGYRLVYDMVYMAYITR